MGLTLLIAGPVAAAPAGSDAAAESRALCQQADVLTGEARAQALARGMALAEGAREANDGDALAHFALACNLGKQMEESSLGGQLMRLPRLRRELDAALVLAPDDADALTAKGALLVRLPRLLGGDLREAEQLLRRALAAEPDNDTARCYLAEALTALGAADDARALDAHC